MYPILHVIGMYRASTCCDPTVVTSENNTESDSEVEEDVEDEGISEAGSEGGLLPESSSSDCGECCGGHAPHPGMTSPRSPNIIPATMCKVQTYIFFYLHKQID